MSEMLRIYHMGSGNESLFGLIGQSPEQQRDVHLPEGWNAVMEDGRMMVAAPHCGVKWDLEDCLHAEEGEPVLMGPEGETVPLRYSMDSFAQEIGNSIRAFLPPNLQDKEIQVKKLTKLNRPEVHSLVVFDNRPDEPAMAPNVYLEEFYDQYQSGTKMEDILEEVAQKSITVHSLPDQELKDSMKELVDNASNWEYMKERVILSPVGVDMNREMLSDLPHRTMGDIAGIYRIYVGENDLGRGYITINNDMMGRWGVTEEDLNHAAVENSMSVQPARLMSMNSVMSELVGEMGDPMELPEEPGQGLYVLTNKSKQMGAATIFYPDVADKIEALFPNGCYVIPSSIHELLLTSKDTLPPEDIAAMVREINNTQVATEDLLSYKVHEYDPKTRTIGLVGGKKDLGQQKAEEQSSHLGLAWLDNMEKPGRAR